MTPLGLLLLLLRLVIGLSALAAGMHVGIQGVERILGLDILRAIGDEATAVVMLFVAGVALFGLRFLRFFEFSKRPA